MFIFLELSYVKIINFTSKRINIVYPFIQIYELGILFLIKKKILYIAQDAAINTGANVKIALNIIFN